jgi:hypothetical protein
MDKTDLKEGIFFRALMDIEMRLWHKHIPELSH